jgi:hypothetical protein
MDDDVIADESAQHRRIRADVTIPADPDAGTDHRPAPITVPEPISTSGPITASGSTTTSSSR